MSEYDNSNNEIDLEKKEKVIDFWSTNPNILFKSDYLYELFPTDSMTFNQQLNATTRLVIILTIFLAIIYKNTRVVMVSLFTIFLIYVIHYYNNKMELENFEDPVKETLDEHNVQTDDVFDEPTSSNPFSNVLITDYEYNPNKKPAPPSFNENINEQIMEESKKMVQEMNPDQPNISDKLFKDLGEQYTFEQSLRQFHSNPNTRIPNDQKSFAEFCYGNMVSCKEGNLFACARNKMNHNLY